MPQLATGIKKKINECIVVLLEEAVATLQWVGKFMIGENGKGNVVLLFLNRKQTNKVGLHTSNDGISKKIASFRGERGNSYGLACNAA